MTTAAQRFSTEGFGPDNLPYASFSPAGGDPRLGVRLGDLAISLRDLVAAVAAADGPRLPVDAGTAASAANLDALLALPRLERLSLYKSDLRRWFRNPVLRVLREKGVKVTVIS